MEISKELIVIDKIIAEKLDCDALILSESSKYLLSLGGKRIRPRMCLLINALLRSLLNLPLNTEVYELAAGIELIHMATLLHDDIIDKSNLRRHKASPRAKYGENCTLLSGDFMLVRSFGICSKYSSNIIKETEKACVELTEGEVLEIFEDINTSSLEKSAQIAIKKTASLFRLAAYCGASLAIEDSEELKAWSNFGESLGLAYQMFDDIADALLEENILGKPSGLDIIEKKPSLINIIWLQSGSELAKKIFLKSLNSQQSELENSSNTVDELSKLDLALALSEIRTKSISEKAYNIAKHKYEESLKALEQYYGHQKWIEITNSPLWHEISEVYNNLSSMLLQIIKNYKQ